MRTFVGATCGPRPCLCTDRPSISSDQGGLSASLTFALKCFGFCNVVARFICFSLSQRNDVWASASFGIHQDNNLTAETPKHNKPLFRIGLPDVFARNRKIVPDRLAADEVKPVSLNVG